jgi:NAD(P)-dependent dehydrogenase (short-subunit alcohol dehydrogenase family)
LQIVSFQVLTSNLGDADDRLDGARRHAQDRAAATPSCAATNDERLMTTRPLALVSGASSGIGEATALLLAQRGWTVAATGRRQDRLAELAAKAPAGSIHPFAADLTDDAAVAALITDITDRLGPLRGLVNSAGVLEGGSLENASFDSFDRVMNINVRSVALLTKAALPSLRQTGAGASIVNVSSVTGTRSFPGILAYCVSKAALDQMTRCLALELAADGIRVNAVNPGVVVTELHRAAGMDDAAYAAFLERGRQTHPMGRVGQPDEVAEAIVWLLSDVTGWITGATLPIDGGRHLTCAR